MKFFTRSLLILLALYGLIFALGTAYLAHAGAPLWLGFAFVIVFAAFQFLIAPWVIEGFLDISWVQDSPELPAVNREFIERLCAERGLPVPRIGIIYSGTPNAFCFGRVRRDARLVITSGLLDTLTPDEANSVIAHELGHIEHRDFILMTIASLAPLLLYHLYVLAEKVSDARAVAYGAYVCYWFSQFIVLLLNRTREYFADSYSAKVTGKPEALASALVKIACGMVRADGEYRESLQRKSGKDKAQYRREHRIAGAMGLMGISSQAGSPALALAQTSPAEAAAVMRWDLVSPWARVYQINSTHPLTALRVRALNREAESMHRASPYPLPTDAPTNWAKFPLELMLWATPVITGSLLLLHYWWSEALEFFGVDFGSRGAPLLLTVTGLLWILRVSYRYAGEFTPATVSSLLEDTSVSQMQPRAVVLKGRILGRGVPGAFWSPDLVLRDSSGMVFVLYRQSIPFARFLFAVNGAEDYIDREVVIEGWFRRGIAPYVEMARLTAEDGTVRRTYSRWVQYGVAGVAAVFGLLWLL